MGVLCLATSCAPTGRDRWDASSQHHHAHRQCADPSPASRACSTTCEAARIAVATRRDALASIAAAALTGLSTGPASANSALRDYLQSRQRIYALAPIYGSEQRLAVLYQLSPSPQLMAMLSPASVSLLLRCCCAITQETLQLLSEAQDEATLRQALLAVRRASMNCYTFEVSGTRLIPAPSDMGWLACLSLMYDVVTAQVGCRERCDDLSVRCLTTKLETDQQALKRNRC